MNQSYSRTHNLLTFKCDAASLASLIEKLRGHFPGLASVTVVINEGRRRLSCDSVDELLKTPDLPAEVGTWSFRVSSYVKGDFHELTVYSGLRGIRRAEVSVTGPTAEWCAGIVEAVTAFAARYRVWQSYVPWTAVTGIVWLAMGAILAMALSSPPGLYDHGNVSTYVAVGVLSVVVAITAPRMLPCPTLVFRHEDDFWKRNQAAIVGITALVTMAAAVATAVGTFLLR